MAEFDWIKDIQRGAGGGSNGNGGGGRPPGPDFKPPEIAPEKAFATLWAAAAVLLLLWGGSTAYFTVEANEEAVVLRLGEIESVVGPGFHGRLPFGVDKVYKGAVTTVHQAEFGYRTISAGVKSQFDYTSPEVLSEATMLTGDLNLVLVNWEVRYKISNLEHYLFQVRDPVGTLRDISEAIMRTEIGDRSVDEVLTIDRTTIENEVADEMRIQLKHFKCGIQVVKVNLKRADPPADVKDAFNAVNRAIQIRDRIVNDAEGERNKKLPAARGQKERVIKEAEGYKIGRINRAQGEADAFTAVLTQYQGAKDITRKRLYLDAMEKSLKNVGELTILDGQSEGVLKLLDLNRPTDNVGSKRGAK
jgi:membrane protease subunit HflK